MKRKIFGILFTLVLVLSLTLVTAVPVYAIHALTPGASVDIDADTNGGAYKSLNSIAFTDLPGTDLAATNTFYLTAPTGFEFLPTAVADQAIGAGYGTTNIDLGNGVGGAQPPVYSGSDTVATWTVTAAGVGTVGTITISGMMIRPTAAKTAIVGNGEDNVTIFGNVTTFDSNNAHPIDHVPGALNNFLVEAQGGGNIGTQTAGTAFPIQITARDQHNNTLNDGNNFFDGAGNTVDITSNVTISAGGGTSGVFTAGVLNNHSMTLTGASAAATITATDSAGGLGFGTETGTSNAFTVNPGALLVSFTITGTPATILAGAAFPSAITVTAYDSYVNVKTDYTGTVTWSSSSTVATLPANYTFVGGNLGVYPFPGSQFRLSTAGTQTITVTDGAVSAISGGIAVTPTLTWGGGWAPPTPTIETNLFGKVSRFRFHITTRGEIREMIKATSGDGMLTMTIPAGTIALDKDGNPLSTLTSDVDVSPPPPPSHIIGLAYDFGPDGATFDPGITLNWNYDLDALPEGVAEEDLVIACYDEEAGEWVECPSTVDLVTHTITASVSHFTTFAIIAHAAPAAFSASNLSIQPSEVHPEEAVTITLSVANTGGTEGSYAVVLKINDVKETEKSVTVAAGASEEVTFTTAKDVAGSYSVAVNGLSGSFTVKEKPAPAPAPPPPPPPTPPPAPEAINWWLIGGIIAAVVVVGLLILFLVVRRRA